MFIVVPRAPFLRRLLVYSSKLHNQRAFNIEDPCSINCSTMVPHPDSTGAHNEYTAGIIIIGDEILKGQVQDVNTYFLCKRLREMGVTVSKVSMVSDSLEDIATEVRDFSKRFRFVITTGGIGPTHDDRTFEAVGKAFDVPLALHPDVAKFCEEWYGSTDRSLPVFKLAMIPTNAKLNYGRNPETGEIVRFPLVQVHNVYIFPGIPQLLVNAMNRLGKKLFANPSFSRYEASLYVNVDEPSAAPVLNQAVAKFPDVEFGSYPVLFNSYYRVQFTMEGKSEERIKQAETFLKDSFPDKIVSYDPYPTVDAWEKHQALLASSKTSEGLKNFLKHAIEVLEKTYNDYRPEEVVLFFNGGKDCTVALHVLHAYLQHHHPEARKNLKVAYIREEAPFPEMQEFISDTTKRYNLKLRVLSGPLRSGLETLLSEDPQIKAGVMGTRFGDPYSESQTEFQPTDSGWPPLMRVNPLLRWSYGEVWEYLRSLSVHYCSLYDRGYSSIGCVARTLRNPKLLQTLPDGRTEYRPAYELTDFHEERAGRIGCKSGENS